MSSIVNHTEYTISNGKKTFNISLPSGYLTQEYIRIDELNLKVIKMFLKGATITIENMIDDENCYEILCDLHKFKVYVSDQLACTVIDSLIMFIKDKFLEYVTSILSENYVVSHIHPEMFSAELRDIAVGKDQQNVVEIAVLINDAISKGQTSEYLRRLVVLLKAYVTVFVGLDSPFF